MKTTVIFKFLFLTRFFSNYKFTSELKEAVSKLGRYQRLKLKVVFIVLTYMTMTVSSRFLSFVLLLT